jgi:uncharacterized Zn finger protein
MQYNNPLFKFNYRTGEWEVDAEKLTEIFGEPNADSVFIPPPYKVLNNKHIIGKTAVQQTVILNLEHQASPETVNSGRSLARQQANILVVEVRPGRAKAFMMAGNHYFRHQSQWFTPSLEFPVANEAQQQQIMHALTNQIDSLASLMQQQLPDSAAQIFLDAGIDLLRPVKLHCSCRVQPCAHELALAYVLVTLVNTNPWHTLLLHGITPALLAQGLADKQLLPQVSSVLKSMWSSGVVSTEIGNSPNLRGQLVHLPLVIERDLSRIHDTVVKSAEAVLPAYPPLTSDLQPLYPPLAPLDDSLPPLNSRESKSLAEIEQMLETLCTDHLDAEYHRLARQVVRQFVRQDAKAITAGNRWGNAFLYLLLHLNHWYIPGQAEPGTEDEVLQWIGASQSVLRKYAQTIRETLQLSPSDPRYVHSVMRPSVITRRWLLRRGNLIVDYRILSPTEQAEVRERGLLGVMLEYL